MLKMLCFLSSFIIFFAGCQQCQSNVDKYSTLYTDERAGKLNGIGPVEMGFSDGMVKDQTCFMILEPGGWGNKFTTVSLFQGITMSCEYGGLSFIGVGLGWAGETDRGIKIGSTKKEVKKAYPEAVPDSGNLQWKRRERDGPKPTSRLWETKISFVFIFDRLFSIRMRRCLVWDS
jgi:hypothetical protein